MNHGSQDSGSLDRTRVPRTVRPPVRWAMAGLLGGLIVMSVTACSSSSVSGNEGGPPLIVHGDPGEFFFDQETRRLGIRRGDTIFYLNDAEHGRTADESEGE